MSLAFVAAGACEIITGLALRLATAPGRLILMAGGLAGLLVAANPEQAGGSLAHAFWAAVGFAALVAWPLGAAAGAFGAVGTAASRFGRRCRDNARPARVVQHGVGHGRRTSRPG
jgi:hypothetical protein